MWWSISNDGWGWLCILTDGLWSATVTNCSVRVGIPLWLTPGGILEMFRLFRLALLLVRGELQTRLTCYCTVYMIKPTQTHFPYKPFSLCSDTDIYFSKFMHILCELFQPTDVHMGSGVLYQGEYWKLFKKQSFAAYQLICWCNEGKGVDGKG